MLQKCGLKKNDLSYFELAASLL